MAIGMAGALMILLWLQNMLTMDRYHEKSDRLYIMSNRDENQGSKHAWPATPKILGPSIKEEFPDIESFSRYSNFHLFLTTYQDKKLKSQLAFVDSGLFEMFSFSFISGDKTGLLKDPNSIVLTEKKAKALFGSENPIGKIIKIDSVNQVKVQAVIQDNPSNSSFDFEGLISWEYGKNIGFYDENWGNNSIKTFILLKEGISLASFNEKIKPFTRNHINADKDMIRSGSKSTVELFAFPFQDYYLYNNGKGGIMNQVG
ncbi:ABC transporter permease [Sphingobacterium sp. NPDC055346]